MRAMDDGVDNHGGPGDDLLEQAACDRCNRMPEETPWVRPVRPPSGTPSGGSRSRWPAGRCTTRASASS